MVAEITRQRTGELLRGVFGILLDEPNGLPAREVLERVARRVPPTPFEASEYPNSPGVRRYEKIIRFHTINTVKAGWFAKDAGQWSLTDQGKQAYEQYQDAEQFMKQAVALYRQWKKGRPEPEDIGDLEEVEIVTSLEEAEETAWTEIKRYLEEIPPYDFQQLVAALLEAMDYEVAWVAPPGPDKGIDILAYADPLGTTVPRIKVQVKRRSDKVNADTMRAFMAVLGEQDVGIFIALGGFTSEAESEARMQERRRVTLVGLRRLVDLWVEHYAHIPEPERQLLPLKPVHFLSSRD